MTRWLSPEEQVAWRNFLDVNARLMERLDGDLQQRADLAITDYEILVMLSEAEDRQLRMSELAEQVIVSRSRLTYRVDRLAKRGLVSRQEFAADRRGVLAMITDEGLQVLESLAPSHVELVQTLIFDHIDAEELPVFAGVMERISKACDEQVS